MANRLHRQLVDYDLLQVQYAHLEQAEQQQRIKITALQMQLTQERIKVNLQVDYTTRVERALRKERTRSTIARVAIPLAFVLGIIL